MEFHMEVTDVREDWAHSSFLTLAGICSKEVPFQHISLKVGRCLSPRPLDIDDNGRIIRSPDALRPLTLCNCDCKLLTSAICRGLHWYTMRCIHPSQRCTSSRQMTDNIFEIETTALAHVAGAPQESGLCCRLSQRQSCLDPLCDRED